MKLKSQSSFEFVILVGFVLIIFSAFFVYIEGTFADKAREQQTNAVKDVVLMIQDEINLASQSIDGYSRDFTLPQNINGQDYNITIVGGNISGLVYIETAGKKDAMALSIVNITGNLIKGKNTIRKIGGEIRLNSFLNITSDFNNSQNISAVYASCGSGYQNKNPPLNISNIYISTKSMALLVTDLNDTSVVNWIVWNISSNTSRILRGSVPLGSIQGNNSYNDLFYEGMCPPGHFMHQYSFKIYALDTQINLPNSSTKADLLNAISGHVLDSAELIGNYST